MTVSAAWQTKPDEPAMCKQQLAVTLLTSAMRAADSLDRGHSFSVSRPERRSGYCWPESGIRVTVTDFLLTHRESGAADRLHRLAAADASSHDWGFQPLVNGRCSQFLLVRRAQLH